jgi:hypothetical protein
MLPFLAEKVTQHEGSRTPQDDSRRDKNRGKHNHAEDFIGFHGRFSWLWFDAQSPQQ